MALLEIKPRTAHPDGIARLPKGVANSNARTRADYVAGAIEAPLPLTPERLELIKAYAESRSPHTDGVAASRIAQRFAPRPPAVPSGGEAQPAVQAPLTAPFFAMASGIKRLTAILVVAALLPNLTLAAFWLRAIDMPWSKPAASSKASPTPVHAALPPPVLSAPSALEASAGQHVSFPIALDGTDAIPPSSVIVISGLPQGSRLSSGQRRGATEWTLRPDEIGDLHLVLPAFANAEIEAHHPARRARRSRRRRRRDDAQLDRRSRHCRSRSRRGRNRNRASGATNLANRSATARCRCGRRDGIDLCRSCQPRCRASQCGGRAIADQTARTAQERRCRGELGHTDRLRQSSRRAFAVGGGSRRDGEGCEASPRKPKAQLGRGRRPGHVEDRLDLPRQCRHNPLVHRGQNALRKERRAPAQPKISAVAQKPICTSFCIGARARGNGASHFGLSFRPESDLGDF